jgi:hypothetical protein
MKSSDIAIILKRHARPFSLRIFMSIGDALHAQHGTIRSM